VVGDVALEVKHSPAPPEGGDTKPEV